MAKQSDWCPTTRQGQLDMAKNWEKILREADDTIKGTKAMAWGIPDTAVNDLSELATKAEDALTAAKNEETRTPVTTAQCKTAFDALVAKERDMKKRSFYVPPLKEADLVALGLKIPDTTPTASGTPTDEVTIETYLVGRHQLGIKIIYLTGSANNPANKGYRVWYSVIGQGETPPTNPKELKESFFTKRKKDVITFDFGDSGKTAYFAVQIENEGKKGPWGPLTSALIP
jgi:hypothetical protein